MPEDVRRVYIPFERYDNLIIIPITVNGGLELKFILDTGVKYPMLTESALGNVLGMEYVREIIIYGRGVNDSISANVVKHVKLELTGGIKADMYYSFLVLKEDYLEIKKNLGVEVYGVIGSDIFRDFVVDIDYEDNFITLIRPDTFRPKRRYSKIPILLSKGKPYMDITIQDDNGIEVTQPMMVDTGASHSILLDPSQDNIIMPDVSISSVIGRGLAGDIYGYLGRIDAIQVDEFELCETIATFPVSSASSSLAKRGSKYGTVGGEFLSRFHVVFDYSRGHMYLKKNKFYDKEFEHDMSGLFITAAGHEYNSYEVSSVRQDSPADQAGIMKGDVILSINGYTYEMLKLNGAHAMLRDRPGKKIVVRIERGEKTIKKQFRLERFI